MAMDPSNQSVEDAVQEADGISSILILNDDCLEMIFSYFDLKQVIKLETVCKRFKAMSEYFYSKQTYFKFDRIIFIEETLEIVERVGPHVRTLRFGHDFRLYTHLDKVFQFLSAFTMVQVLHIDENSYGYYFLTTVKSSKDSLEHVQIVSAFITDDGVFDFVKDCPKIKVLDIRKCSRLSNDLIIKKLLPIMSNRSHMEIFVARTGIKKCIVKTLAEMDTDGKIILNWEEEEDHDESDSDDSEDEYLNLFDESDFDSDFERAPNLSLLDFFGFHFD